MSESSEAADPIVGFERHPAAINRHLFSKAGRLPPPGFANITTWFPHRNGEVEPAAADHGTAPDAPPATAVQQPWPEPPPAPLSWAHPQPPHESEDWAERQAGQAQYREPDDVQGPDHRRTPGHWATPEQPEEPQHWPKHDHRAEPQGWALPLPEPQPPPEMLLDDPPAPVPDVQPEPEPAPDPAPIPHLGLHPAPVASPPPSYDPEPAPVRDALPWPGLLTPRPVAPAPAADMLWPAEFVAATAQPAAPRRAPWLRRGAFAAVAVAALVALTYVGLRLAPAWLNGGSVDAVFNAPMMVVRAAATGRVTAVSANAGQVVEPRSLLLTIHTDDPTNPDRPVVAGVHGVVRSIETVPGADLTTGAPLARLHDCDRAFLTVSSNSRLTPGQAVSVSLPHLPVVTGTVRRSTGVMEPPDSLVVGLTPGAMGAACPVGATATVQPVSAG